MSASSWDRSLARPTAVDADTEPGWTDPPATDWSGAGTTDPDTAAFLHALGRRVRLLRTEREFTQSQLAAHTDMSRSFLSIIENGERGVDVVRLHRLAAAFGIPLSDLIGGAERRQRECPK